LPLVSSIARRRQHVERGAITEQQVSAGRFRENGRKASPGFMESR
jgi:hypothetical protein